MASVRRFSVSALAALMEDGPSHWSARIRKTTTVHTSKMRSSAMLARAVEVRNSPLMDITAARINSPRRETMQLAMKPIMTAESSVR